MLRGMGFDNHTTLYVAAGKIYKVDKHMAPLKQMFPYLETKDTLVTPEELTPFTVSSKWKIMILFSEYLREVHHY